MHDLITFEAVTFEVDKETRTLTGTLLPFNEVSRPTRDPETGMTARFRFTEDTTELGEVSDCVLNFGHDRTSLYTQVGIATHLTKTAEGVLAKFKIARTPEGDRVLALAEDKVLKAFSAEVAGEFVDDADGIKNAKATSITGAAIAIKPAFAGAHITSVAASAAQTEGVPMTTETVETAPVSFSAEDGKALSEAVTALTTKVDALADMKVEAPAGAQFTVTEEPIYRFDCIPASSGHDLSSDLIAGINGDEAAYTRVLSFMSEAMINPSGVNFVASSNVSSVNPSQYRPDMFKDEQPAQPSPMYDTFYAGGLSSVQPFFYSQLGAYTGLIGAHTEGTPPTAGTFTTESGATITPSAVSGRIFLTREVADLGGNPQVSGLIWEKFQRVFRLMLEERAAKVLHDNLASFSSPTAAIADGADGAAIGDALKAGLVDLKFTSNGGRFRRFFSAKGLYKSLSAAKDGNDRPLFPIVAPSNADGTTESQLGSITVAGIKLEPTWSTEIDWNGPTAGGIDLTSFYVDPAAVKVWNSGLTKLDKVSETAAGWNIDVFAYVASHLYDATGVRKVAYDPEV